VIVGYYNGKKMRNTLIKAPTVTDYRGRSSLAKPNTARGALCSSVTKDSWLMRISKRAKSDSCILGAISSTVHGPTAEGINQGRDNIKRNCDTLFYVSTLRC
jgi:hypothetical protein